MTSDRLQQKVDSRGVARVVLADGGNHNVFDGPLVAALTEAFQSYSADRKVRVVVIEAQGPTFSAGAGRAWLESIQKSDFAENASDAKRFAQMLDAVNRCPKPVLCRVQGNAYGAGVGLVACADVALTVTDARFCFTEVRLGLVPSEAAPFLIAKVGLSAARRFFLTAEIFPAALALQLGLVHHVLPDETQLDEQLRKLVTLCLKGGAEAQRISKALIHEANPYLNESLTAFSAEASAHRRVSVEGQEGMKAFFDRRPPNWVPPLD